jgi:hypothetical protein
LGGLKSPANSLFDNLNEMRNLRDHSTNHRGIRSRYNFPDSMKTQSLNNPLLFLRGSDGASHPAETQGWPRNGSFLCGPGWGRFYSGRSHNSNLSSA